MPSGASFPYLRSISLSDEIDDLSFFAIDTSLDEDFLFIMEDATDAPVLAPVFATDAPAPKIALPAPKANFPAPSANPVKVKIAILYYPMHLLTQIHLQIIMNHYPL